MGIPENFVLPDVSKISPTGPSVVRPVYGNLGSQYVRFYTHKEYSGADSTRQDIEVYRTVEICEIQNDKFSKAAIRVSDLTPQQQIDLAPLYEQFKTQRDSNATQVMQWDAVTENEKVLLLSAGICTVEQLNALSKEETFRLGVGAESFMERAKRHLAAKEATKSSDRTAEMQLLAEENRKLKEKLKEKESAMFARHVNIASEERKTKGRPKKEAQI